LCTAKTVALVEQRCQCTLLPRGALRHFAADP
jgi:hypothetical protein